MDLLNDGFQTRLFPMELLYADYTTLLKESILKMGKQVCEIQEDKVNIRKQYSKNLRHGAY